MYRGIAKGKIIELEGDSWLPDGMRVEVSIEQGQAGKTAAEKYPEGSTYAFLVAAKSSPSLHFRRGRSADSAHAAREAAGTIRRNIAVEPTTGIYLLGISTRGSYH